MAARWRRLTREGGKLLVCAERSQSTHGTIWSGPRFLAIHPTYKKVVIPGEGTQGLMFPPSITFSYSPPVPAEYDERVAYQMWPGTPDYAAWIAAGAPPDWNVGTRHVSFDVELDEIVNNPAEVPNGMADFNVERITHTETRRRWAGPGMWDEYQVEVLDKYRLSLAHIAVVRTTTHYSAVTYGSGKVDEAQDSVRESRVSIGFVMIYNPFTIEIESVSMGEGVSASPLPYIGSVDGNDTIEWQAVPDEDFPAGVDYKKKGA